MRNITRRRFIEDSIFASAALAATTSGSLWLPKPVRAQESVSPNEKLGVLLVGCGGRGGSHMGEYLADERVKIVCVCDPDVQHANQAADNKRP